MPSTLVRGCWLDRADGEGDDVFDRHGFFLEEGLAVFYADELAVVAGEEFHAAVEFVDGEENALLAFAFGGAELGAVGEDGAVAGFVLPGDVDNERGGHSLKGSGVEDLEGTIRFAIERKLLKAGEEATFVA